MPTIVFGHANGFPAGTYRVLFERWRRAGWAVHAPPRFGHDPRYPVASNWRALRDEFIDFIVLLDVPGPVQLVGHSLGGFLSVLVASRRPDLVAGVVLLDSPMLTGWRAHSVQAMKLTGLMSRVSPGRVSRRRRQHWPSHEDVHRHFAAKPAFARWDPRVLADYVHAGFEPDDGRGGVRLAFRRDIETRIYDTLPHHLGTVLQRRPLRCPVQFLGGTQSVEVHQVGLEATRRLTHGRIGWLEGTHLFPMERPDETAERVLALLDPHVSHPTAAMAPAPAPAVQRAISDTAPPP